MTLPTVTQEKRHHRNNLLGHGRTEHFSLERWREYRLIFLILPCSVFLIVFFAFPLVRLLWLSIFTPSFTLDNYIKVFGVTVYLNVLFTSLKIAFNCTVLCLILGYPLAYLLNSVNAVLRNVILVFIVVPYFLSLLVRIYGWYMILGRNGVLNYALVSLGILEQPAKLLFNYVGVHVGMVNMLLPYMILTLFGVMRGIDVNLVKAARNLGANHWRAFFHVFLPLSLPGVGAGCLLVFILGVGYFVIPALMGGRKDMMISQLISMQVSELMKWEFAAALSFVLLMVTAIVIFIFNHFLGLDRIWGGEGKGQNRAVRKVGESRENAFSLASKLRDAENYVPSYACRGIRSMLSPIFARREFCSRLLESPWLPWKHDWFRRGLKRTEGIGFIFFCASVLLFLAAPIFIIIPMSFNSLGYLAFPPSGFSLRWYGNYFGSERWVAATLMSFKVAGITALIGTILGIPASICLVRGKFRGKNLLNTFIMFPIIIPSIIVSIAIYFLFAKLHLVGNALAIAVGHCIITIPIIVIIVSANIKGFDENLERAARNLGASPLRTFLAITLPILAPGILSAAFFAFMRSFDEVVIALFLSGPATRTLPMRMWEGIREEIDPTIAAVSSLLIVFCVLILALSEVLRRKTERTKVEVRSNKSEDNLRGGFQKR